MTLSALGIFSAAGASIVPIGTGAGYTLGGAEPGNAYVTTVDKFDLTNDSRSTLGSGLPVANRNQGSVSDVAKGFVARGNITSERSRIYRLTFSTDAINLLGATLSGAFEGMAGAASTTNGYFLGGGDNAGNQYSQCDKLNFSAESTSTLGTGLSSARGGGFGLQSSTHAYAAGGRTGNAGPQVTTIDKFAFTNDARSTLGTGLNTAVDYGSGAPSSTTAGYLFGGVSSGAYISAIQKVTFATDATSTLAATLSANNGGGSLSGFQNNVAGYATGGEGAGSSVSTVGKLFFTSETRTNLATGLSAARILMGAVSNKG